MNIEAPMEETPVETENQFENELIINDIYT